MSCVLNAWSACDVWQSQARNLYNSIKGGLDTFDPMSSFQSCSRMTKRWPPSVFYGILKSAVVNAYVLYNEHKPQNNSKHRWFQNALALNMIKGLPNQVCLAGCDSPSPHISWTDVTNTGRNHLTVANKTTLRNLGFS